MAETRRTVVKRLAGAAALAALPRGVARRGFASPAAVVADQAVAVQTELTLGIYDDFDGTGSWQAFDGSMLAEAGAFSKELWAFYGGPSEIVALGDVPPPPMVTADEHGVPLDADPGVVAALEHAARAGDPLALDPLLLPAGLARVRVVRHLAPELWLARLAEVLATEAMLTPDGRAALGYLATGDLSRLAGLGEPAFRLTQAIRRGAWPEGRRGPRAMRAIALDDFEGWLPHRDGTRRWASWRRGEELGRAELVRRQDVPGYEQRLAAATSPRARRRLHGEQGPHPDGYVCRMSYNRTGSEVRLELASAGIIGFQDFGAWSADMMIPDLVGLSSKFFFGMDFHTSVPEQPPGISWLCGLGIAGIREDEFFGEFRYLRNKNTGVGFYDWVDPGDAGLGGWSASHWYRHGLAIRVDLMEQLAIDFSVNGKCLLTALPEDSDLLLHPTLPRFGPIRSFSLERNNDDGPATGYIDNVHAVHTNRVA